MYAIRSYYGYLGSDFALAFNAMLNPQANTMQFDGVVEPLGVEFASMGTEPPVLASIGVADMTQSEQEQVQELLNRILPPEDGKLGRTDLIEHVIDVGSARPVKQRYYPLSQKIEEEMYAQVRKMLEEDIIEPSSSSWSSPVVMVRKRTGRTVFASITAS